MSGSSQVALTATNRRWHSFGATMFSRRALAYVACALAAGSVAWGLVEAQRPSYLVDLCPPTYCEITKLGWPMLFVLRDECGDPFFPKSATVKYDVQWRELVENCVVWLVLVASPVYVTWRVVTGPMQFSIASVLAVAAVVAIFLAWWQREYAFYYVPGHPVLTELTRLNPKTPLLRLLLMPAPVAASVLFGTTCAALLLNILGMRLVGLALRWVTRTTHSREVTRCLV